jgi:hypothetical protein
MEGEIDSSQIAKVYFWDQRLSQEEVQDIVLELTCHEIESKE